MRGAIAQFIFQVPTLDMKMQATVELARMLWRLLQLSLAPCGPNCRPKPLRLGVGMLFNKGGQRVIVFEQPVAPCFGLMHQRHRSA